MENISLRDWFAGQAMPLADSVYDNSNHNYIMAVIDSKDSGVVESRDRPLFVAAWSYRYSDAMLAQREKR